MKAVEVVRGDSPIVLGFPHTGTFIPPAISARLNRNGLLLADTDWHVDELYDGLLPGATTVRALFHRYVIDANRDPSGVSLYPGQNTTDLVPLTDFDANPIWRDGQQASADEIAERKTICHAAYHAALQGEVERIKELHGCAILHDCHSIRSVVPHLFDGTLPDFNIGDNNGTTCAPQITEAVAGACRRARQYSCVVNGRFRGGWTTRHYGKPHQGIHAIQMELAQSTHLKTEKPPFAFDSAKANRLRPVLRSILQELAATAGSLS